MAERSDNICLAEDQYDQALRKESDRLPDTLADPTHEVGEPFSRREGAPALSDAVVMEIARAARAMASRFQRRATLFTFGSGQQSADAQHVAVEFTHPVVVGKRALRASALTNDVASLTEAAASHGSDGAISLQLDRLAQPGDIALGLAATPYWSDVRAAFRTASEKGLLTLGLVGASAAKDLQASRVDHAIVAPTDDPLITREIHVTAYHILWELVHALLDQQRPLSEAECDP